MISNPSTLLLLLLRTPILIFGGFLIINLGGSFFRESRKADFDKTRMATLLLMIAIFIDATVISIAYAHQVVGSTFASVWLSKVEPLLIANRLLYAYAVYRFFRLFCCKRKDKQ